MGILNDRIKEMRIRRGMTLLQVAEKLGVREATMQRYESGDIKNIKHETIAELSDIFGCPPSYLMGWDVPESLARPSSLGQFHEFQVIGEISAGYGAEAVEQFTEHTELIPTEWLKGHTPDEFFVLRVKGNSMYPQFIEGDDVLVQRQTCVDSGSVAVVLYNDSDATLKKLNYTYGQGWMELIPINPEYPIKRIEGRDLENCRVLGKVVKLMRNV